MMFYPCLLDGRESNKMARQQNISLDDCYYLALVQVKQISFVNTSALSIFPKNQSGQTNPSSILKNLHKAMKKVANLIGTQNGYLVFDDIGLDKRCSPQTIIIPSGNPYSHLNNTYILSQHHP